MFLKCRLKYTASKKHARQMQVVKLFGVGVWINVWSADQLKRFSSAAFFRDLRAFEMHCAGKNSCGVERRHVRRRQHPGRVCIIVPEVTFPSSHSDYFEFAMNLEVFIEESRQFANGHSMTSR